MWIPTSYDLLNAQRVMPSDGHDHDRSWSDRGDSMIEWLIKWVDSDRVLEQAHSSIMIEHDRVIDYDRSFDIIDHYDCSSMIDHSYCSSMIDHYDCSSMIDHSYCSSMIDYSHCSSMIYWSIMIHWSIMFTARVWLRIRTWFLSLETEELAYGSWYRI